MHSLPIEGAANFRDFGGYSTQDGRRVRSGLLFRSGALAGLTERGRRQAGALGLGCICDLRRDDERDREPTRLPSNEPRIEHIAIDPGNAVAMRAALAAGDVPLTDRIAFMVAINRDLARDHTEDYARLFDTLLDTDGGFLVHCAAGKDRTGFGVALIQLALGVPHALVTRDYLRTNDVLDWDRDVLPRLRHLGAAADGVDREATLALFGVRPEYLDAAFAEIDARFASVERYLAEALRLTPDAQAALRARYLL